MAEIEDYAKYLSEAASSEIALVHEFRVLYAQDDRSFHVFFEGDEDRLFYLPEIRRQLAGNLPLHSHVCNGKPKLTAVRAELYELNFDKRRYAFFVDRDYDDFLGTQIQLDERTYLTDHYSIENDLATIHSIEVLLTDFGGMSKADPAFKKITEGYQRGFKEFSNCMLPFSAWIISMRENGKRTNLNNVNLANIFEITASGLIKKKPNAFDIFRKNVGLQNEKSSCVPIIKWSRKLRDVDPKRWVRGKYDAWFFKAYLLVLVSMFHKRGISKWKIPSPLREDRIFEALGGRIFVPRTLEEFLGQACCG